MQFGCNVTCTLNESFNLLDTYFPLEGDFFFSQILTSDLRLAILLGFHNTPQYFTKDERKKKNSNSSFRM